MTGLASKKPVVLLLVPGSRLAEDGKSLVDAAAMGIEPWSLVAALSDALPLAGLRELPLAAAGSGAETGSLGDRNEPGLRAGRMAGDELGDAGLRNGNFSRRCPPSLQ